MVDRKETLHRSKTALHATPLAEIVKEIYSTLFTL